MLLALVAILFVVATAMVVYASMYMKDTEKDETVTCTKNLETVSVPLTGEPESAHDIYDCGIDHGYVYLINSEETDRVTGTKKVGPETITRTFTVPVKNETRDPVLIVAALVYVASMVTFFVSLQYRQ